MSNVTLKVFAIDYADEIATFYYISFPFDSNWHLIYVYDIQWISIVFLRSSNICRG